MRTFLLAISLLLSTRAPAAPKPVIPSGAGICEVLLKAAVLTGPNQGEIGTSQAQRIYAVLSNMSADQQKALFEAFKTHDLNGFAQRIRAGKLSNEERAQLAKVPGAEILLQDFAEIGESLPGVLALQNAGPVILQSMEIIHRQEMAAKTKNVDMLASLGQAARMKRTLENSLINIVIQADKDYQKSWLGNLGYRLKMWWTPLIHPIADIIAWTQAHVRELKRLQLVDKLVVNLFLGETLSNGANDDEVKEALALILDSPEELKEIEQAVREVLYKEFQNGTEIDTGKIDIYASAKRARSTSMGMINEKFDAANIAALKKLNDLLNAVRQRKGLSKRQAKDFDIVELQLLQEAFNRRLALYREFYEGETAKTSAERYRVEESYQEQEFDGYETYTDSDGKQQSRAKYKWVTKYRWVTVRPSFETILTRRFETGDRSVEGLDQVKSSTSAVAKKESTARNAVMNAQNLVANIREGWNDAVMKGVNRDKLLKDMEEYVDYLEKMEIEQKDYLAWSEQQIRQQYGKDIVENFRARNDWMLKRLINAKQLLQQLHELMTRGSLQLTPAYDLFDISQWLYNLNNKASGNLLSKIAVGLTPTAATGYLIYDPTAASQVTQWIQQFTNYVQHLMP